MTTVIFLDDERSPKDVTWVDYNGMFGDCNYHFPSSSKEWYDCLKVAYNRGMVSDIIFSFDHDIQSFGADGAEITGYDCLKSLVSLCLDNNITLPKCVFHTMNHIGKENMESYYKNALKFEVENNCNGENKC